jgi:hypothetical protein
LGVCAKSLAAARFSSFVARGLRSTLPALLAAFGPVTLLLLLFAKAVRHLPSVEIVNGSAPI